MAERHPIIGAHVDDGSPLTVAGQRGADIVQFFLADPQGWKAPKPRPDAEQIRADAMQVVIHSPYVINVATTNNRIRIPSRKLLQAHAKAAAAVGAIGLVVHGGHVNAGDDLDVGYDNWRKVFARAADEGGFPVPILIENTAGGDGAMARGLDRLARLWDAVGDFDPGFCLDTCHAHASGHDLDGIVDRVKAITGRIDLVHANNSRDEFGSGRDRHDNLDSGTIDPELIAAVVAEAQAPAVCETADAKQAADIAYLRERVSAR
jgi:deoxyribonuclease-4